MSKGPRFVRCSHTHSVVEPSWNPTRVPRPCEREAKGKKNKKTAPCKQMFGSHIVYHTNWILAAHRIFFFFFFFSFPHPNSAFSAFSVVLSSQTTLTLQLGAFFLTDTLKIFFQATVSPLQRCAESGQSELKVSWCQLSWGLPCCPSHLSKSWPASNARLRSSKPQKKVVS